MKDSYFDGGLAGLLGVSILGFLITFLPWESVILGLWLWSSIGK